MDGALIGRIVLYISLAWSVFVAVKAVYEAYKATTSTSPIESNPRQDHIHKRSHIITLVGIAFYNLYNIFAYIWFDVEDTGLGADDRTIGVFNVIFMNMLWLVIIDHFKQERVGEVRKTTWKDTLKF